MEPTEHPEQIKRIFADNPQVERLRVDASTQDLDVGFADSLPDGSVLEQIDKSLHRELADREIAGHSSAVVHPVDSAVSDRDFHHRHLGPDVIEYLRDNTRLSQRIVWRRMNIAPEQERPPISTEGPDYRVMLLLSGICGVTALTGHLMEAMQVSGWWAPAAFVIAYVTGGWYATDEVIDELRRRRIDVHFLMLLVAIGAAFVNAWTEGATLLFLFSLSGGLEQFAHHRTRKTISSLLKAAPKHVLRRKAEAWVEVGIEAVQKADELLVKAGELFPVDGTVTEGATAADESALTGESVPVAKRVGDEVSGGTLNLEGAAVIRVTRLPKDSAVQKIVALIESAQQQKAPAQRFTDTFSRYYTWIVLVLSALNFAVLLAWGHASPDAFYRTMTLLVVSSPCALVLSIPSAILVAIASGARHGILFRGGVAVENLADVTHFAFDKTGTLTKGNLRVAEIIPLNGATEADVLRCAASVGQFSTHPLSRAIVSEAEGRGVALDAVTDFQNFTGLGMLAQSGSETLLVGSRALLASRGIAVSGIDDDHAHVEVWAAGAAALGVIHLSDELRPEAKGVIEQLQRDGAAVTLISGDRAAVANDVAATLGIRDVRAGLSPSEKLACIHGWQAEGHKVAMVGDGINDAPSLTAANVAIGMGARGSDAALEQADVILMHDRIENVVEAVALSRRARAVIRQNLVISLGVVVVLVISALFNKINLTFGVVGHEGSTVLVVLNGLRLLRVPRKKG